MNLEQIVQPLGMDVSGYKKGILDAIKGSNNLKDAFKSITSNSAVMGGLVVASITAIAAAGKHGVDQFIEYANEVRNVMQVTGQNAEASSKLIQVLDDLKVTTDDMNKAQKAFTKQGMQMSIDTLGKLSDEYRGLTSATEKADFMQKNFGKDWRKWVETMEQGSVALNKANEAQKGNLILTDQSIKEARLYEMEVDKLTDAWHGFWVELGRNVVHAISDAEIEQRQLNILMEDGNGKLVWAVRHHYALTGAMKETADAARARAEAELYAGDTTSETTQKIIDEKAALDALTAKNNEFIGVLKDVVGENQRYSDTNKDISKEHSDLLLQKEELFKKGYKLEGDAIKDVDKKLQDNNRQMEENKKKHRDWINAKIGDLLLAKLSVDGLTDAETDYYLTFMVQSKQITSADKNIAMGIIGNANSIADGFDEDRESVDQFHARLYALMERYQRALNQALVPIHYHYTITGNGGFPNVPKGGTVSFDERVESGSTTSPIVSPEHNKDFMAGGGAVIGGHSYTVGERGIETFTPNTSGRIDPKNNKPVIARIPREDMYLMAEIIKEVGLKV